MRFIGLASVIGIIGVAGAAGAITLRSGDPMAGATQTSAGNVALRQEGRPTETTPLQGRRAPRPLTPTPARTESAPAAEPPAATSAPVSTPVSLPTYGGPVLDQGRTTLADSIYAIRDGDSVIVNFDTQGHRTRRADKFEQMLRNTLPQIYGRRIAASLDSVPAGSLLPSRDVTGALTLQGVHLTLDNGLRIGLWPQTRSFTDGPLVVAYRAVVEH